PNVVNKELIDALLRAMIESGDGVSDLLFAVGKPPIVERHGALEEFPIDTADGILAPAQIEQIGAHLMNGEPRLADDLKRLGACDCSYSLADAARFRVNIFRQNGRQAIVMRKLQTQIPTLDALGLPPIFREMVKEKNGIIFVTGATGSGKTTTLAAMLNELNETQSIHILTLEDPIEFLHPHKESLFNQRELGKDFPDFASGLRSALRQAPKAILVGEIRDRETMEIAMTASETGHIVFSTMHTINAGQTISRVLGMFGKDEEQQVRTRLAETLRFVVSQRLVKKIDGGRLLISEIMGSSLRTRETLVYGESENRTFQEIIEAGSTMGWHSFDQALLRAFEDELITDETTLLYCAHKNKMRRDIEMLKKLRNQFQEEPSGLRLDPNALAA
ncbi:MAG: PilT/PilU family type 4a pilus ATPase, partial [Verrucomicrobiota bacterium]|nr:PilT/PilU family type 4a pilus ATPase [Verrucomicrobiota bacterium]